MKTTLKKLSTLILSLGTLFILSFPSIAHAADTGGSDHFELTVAKNKDSKSGAEIADLTIKNISGKTGTNVTFEADLPTIFHDKDMKKATFKVDTLKAGESKTYQISRKSDGIVALPTTGNNLPKTGDVTTPLFIIAGLILLVSIVMIGFKRFQNAKYLLALLLLLAGLGGAASVNAAGKSYRHRDEIRNHAVELAGTTHVFHLAGEGDFEGDGDNTGDNGGSGVTKNFTITYYINGDKVTNLSLVYSYVAGDQATELKTPTYEAEDFSGWYDNEVCTGKVITSLAKDATGDKVFYGKITPKTYQVTFDSTGGEAVSSATVNHGQTVSEPSQPENPSLDDAIPNDSSVPHDFAFKGWYTDEKLTTAFDFATLITQDTILYAKWGLPITEAGTNNALNTYTNSTLGDPGDTVWFANSWWRILNPEKGLVLKEASISNTPFITSRSTFFSATNTNGYDDSRNSTNGGVGSVIDDWYDNTILGTANEALVKKVILNNPTFDAFKNNITLTTGSDYSDWYWDDYHQDNRFATELDDTSGTKQAFALSVSDIHVLGLNTNKFSSTLLGQLGTGKDNRFWLRSAGHRFDTANVFEDGSFTPIIDISNSRPVRPALFIVIK